MLCWHQVFVSGCIAQQDHLQLKTVVRLVPTVPVRMLWGWAMFLSSTCVLIHIARSWISVLASATQALRRFLHVIE